ncbi:PLP-dependent aminotransferase family protein [Solibacillus daqui]|uniref:MocR-like pyridoxine biosynthesis transcription factor PdxR n=1 Tax=Solibacillus daqui TaxID=2912187 RepID=UPI0023660343|nr:PLP-dependent aminotransferase family protein [Solibacillus daqui]
MHFQIDRSLKTPLYKQIAKYIEEEILDGTLPTDKPLPSERTLAAELGVNRSTVVTAYDELEAEGLIQRIQGAGTMVTRDIWGMTKKRIPRWNQYIEAGSYLPNTPIAQKIRKHTAEDTLINLASGELSADLFPLAALRNIMATRSFIGHLGYDHPLGNVNLRQTIAKHLTHSRDIKTDDNHILITSGAQQAIHLIIECLLKQGDSVVIEDPSYHYDLQIFKSAGIQTFFLPAGKDGIDPQGLIKLHKRHRIRMIFLNPIFQNPTGTLLSIERRKEILDFSAEYGIPIIEDDPYSLTAFSHEKMSTLKSLDMNGNVLYVSSLSKIVASGLRIGWINGPKSVIERISDVKQQVDFGHASYNQWIANDFLESPFFEAHINELRNKLKTRRDHLIYYLNFYLQDKVEFEIPEGGIHLWCKFKEEIDEVKLLEESMKQGVIFVPGSTMGTKKGYIRLTFAREKEENIKEGVYRLSKALGKISKWMG